MSCTQITVDAPPEVVFSILAEPPYYELWVVGNKTVLGYDPSWPAPGSEFHHKVGFGPLATKDKTIALEADPPHRLVMEARALPFIRATITLTIEPEGPASRVTMEECPRGAPWEQLWNPVLDAVVTLRNVATLRRLKRLAEIRASTVNR